MCGILAHNRVIAVVGSDSLLAIAISCLVTHL